MPERVNFTKATLIALPAAPAGKQATYHDTKIPGLVLLVTAGGAKTFYIYRRIHGRPERVKLGRFPDLTVEQARKLAEETNGTIAKGGDPATARRESRQEMTFGDVFKWYIEHHAKPRKRTWARDVDRHRLHLTGLDGFKVGKVTRAHVREAIAKAAERSGIYEANRALALVRVVFNKAADAGIFDGPNPARGAEMFREQSRDRRLTAGELPAFLAALDAEPNENLRHLVALLLFTGARRGNVLAMRWDEIDWTARTWRIPRTKNGLSQVVPLGDEAIGVLQERQSKIKGPWVFPGESTSGHMTNPHKAWRALLVRAGVKDFRMHDLRRTLGSWMVDTGATIHVVGKALNHQHQATTAIYARLALNPVREAQERAIAAMLARSEQ